MKALGPGLVFALTVLGPGDFVSNAATGAAHGTALLWALAISVGFRYVWLDASARYVLGTGETLMEGYRRLHPALAWFVFGAMVVVRTMSNLYKLVLAGNVVELVTPWRFEGSKWVWGGALCVVSYWLCSRGRYEWLETAFKAMVAAMGAALVVAVALARPEPAEVLKGLLVPVIPADQGLYGTLFLLLALIGTEAGSLTNITYSYFMHQKGWRGVEYRSRQKADLAFGVGYLFLMAALVQVTAAFTLHPLKVVPDGAPELVRIFTQTLGQAGRWIFIFGLSATAVNGFIGCTAGYSLIAADFVARSKGREPAREARTDAVYQGFVAFWCFAPLGLLYFFDRPVWLVLAVSALMGVLIPLLAVLLLKLVSEKRLGALVAPVWLKGALVVLAVAATSLIGVNFWQWVRR